MISFLRDFDVGVSEKNQVFSHLGLFFFCYCFCRVIQARSLSMQLLQLRIPLVRRTFSHQSIKKNIYTVYISEKMYLLPNFDRDDELLDGWVEAGLGAVASHHPDEGALGNPT